MWDEPAQFDRMDEVRRDPGALASLWGRDGTVVLPIDERGSFPVEGETATDGWGTSQAVVAQGQPLASASQPVLRLRVRAAAGAYDPARHWLLGDVEGRVVFAEATDRTGGSTLRDASPLLPPAEAQAAALAAALALWHASEPRCPRCGDESTPSGGGSSRECERCSRVLFPRTDPAVIVAVTDPDDRLLLGHQGAWPAGRYSVLAGFVEAGESLEQAVHREVLEEAGVRLASVAYVASQPWPFPRSIMLGFTARAATSEIQVDGVEIADARWFDRDELVSAVRAGEVLLPGEASIAFRLILEWLRSGAGQQA